MPVWDAIIVSTISRMSHAVVAVVIIILYHKLIGDFEHAACVAPESCRIVPRDKNPDYEMWRADFIRHLQRSGLKNPDKPKIFIKKNVRNHSYQQFYPALAKIRINRGLLYCKKIFDHLPGHIWTVKVLIGKNVTTAGDKQPRFKK